MKILDVPQSGSVAGVTSSRNRYGQYRRTRAIPVNVNSPAQSNVRGILSALSASWRGLLQAYQDAWTYYAAANPRVDSLGQSYNMTGQQAFIDINLPMLLNGTAVVVTPPTGTEPAPVISVDENSIAGPPALAFDPDPVGSSRVMRIFSSPPLSAGRSFNNDFRYLFAVPTAATSPVTIGAELTAKWGSLNSGQRFFLQADILVAAGGATGGLRSVTSPAVVLDLVP